ncbi:MAG: tRNA (N6-threonylcarbamoyladenosine(37)-N6)-methyltransferase TrmO [Acidobacteriota bacterium]
MILMVTLEPIGVIRTPYREKYDAPRQPGAERPEGAKPAKGVIKLQRGHNFEQALDDLSGFERIWVISWFDRNPDWKPKVLPPRGGRTKRGVFATRSPHRPNPIGISVCRLLSVKGLSVTVADPDLLDKTPILDLKPYIPYADAFPDSRIGWLEASAAAASGAHADQYFVEVSAQALRQDAWLEAEARLGLVERARRVLSRDPHPHPYRRTSLRADGAYEFAYKSWRVVYHLEDSRAWIDRIESGYAHMSISSYEDRGQAIPSDFPLHRRFMDAFRS